MTSPSTPVRIADAVDAPTFGGKAAHLAAAARAGLPVPEGIALPWAFVDAVAGGDRDAASLIAAASSPLGSWLAVRSSAVGEDSERASFAGQHLSLLNVRAAALGDAVEAVARSVRGEPALGYRRRLGLTERAGVGVVIQEMVHAGVAGVLFDHNPVTSAKELVIEAGWGLGCAVVDGLVTPDLFRLSFDGEVLERRPGLKELEVAVLAGGGTAERPVAGARARELSLDDGQLAQLHQLATRCKAVFGGSQDIEWAFAAGTLWLLQRRPVTTGRAR